MLSPTFTFAPIPWCAPIGRPRSAPESPAAQEAEGRETATTSATLQTTASNAVRLGRENFVVPPGGPVVVRPIGRSADRSRTHHATDHADRTKWGQFTNVRLQGTREDTRRCLTQNVGAT